MAESTQPCIDCGVEKSLTEFHRDARSGDGRRCTCKPCQARYHRQRSLKRKYGLTEAGYVAMLEAQGYGCAICDAPAEGERYQRLNVDHDHTTGRVRGLLCLNCNHMIGKAGDSPERLRRGISYLENPPNDLQMRFNGQVQTRAG